MKENVYRGVNDKDLARAVSHFQYTFREKTRDITPSGKAKRGSDAYNLQVEFSYMLHELQMTFKHNRQREIANINKFLDSLPSTTPINS